MFRTPFSRFPFAFHSFPRSYSSATATTPKPTSTPTFSPHLQPEQDGLKDKLRMLLRETAQPVAVITSLMPSGSHSHFPSVAESSIKCKYHGATLSSFSSISMDPYPLVSFALRIPSRMAVSLSSTSPPSSTQCLGRDEGRKPMMVINLLSHLQPHEAHLFSRPDLHPHPFSSLSYSLNKDGLPVLDNSLAALTCQLVGGPIALHDLEFIEGRRSAPQSIAEGGGVTSELFLARVLRVEDVHVTEEGEGEEKRTLLPLIYHRRGFTACHTEHLPTTRTNTK